MSTDRYVLHSGQLTTKVLLITMAHGYDYLALPLENSYGQGLFYEGLQPAFVAIYLFGPYKFFGTFCGIFSRILTIAVFCGMLFIAFVGVFYRSAIDTWIQFALYIIPVLTILIGFYVVNADPFIRLMQRKVSIGRWNTFYVGSHIRASDEGALSMPHNFTWVRRNAYKILLYPLLLQAVQRGVYCMFYTKVHGHSFAGSEPTFRVIDDDEIWLSLYICFWIISVYLIGVMACLFIFVSRLIMRDVVSYLSLFGYSPVLKTRRSHLHQITTETLFGRLLRVLLGVLLFDALESTLDTYMGSRPATLKRDNFSHLERLPGRTLENLLERNDNSDEQTETLSQREASILLTQFINEFQDITSLFQPFTIMLSFFSVTSLITHVCLFALRSWELLRFWTFARTLLWLLVTIRILLAVSQISFVLAKIEPHVRYLRAAGKLGGEEKEWDNFFNLAATFKLATRAFGFPLNLRQTASLATLLNMAFLIVISVVRAHYGNI